MAPLIARNAKTVCQLFQGFRQGLKVSFAGSPFLYRLGWLGEAKWNDLSGFRRVHRLDQLNQASSGSRPSAFNALHAAGDKNVPDATGRMVKPGWTKSFAGGSTSPIPARSACSALTRLFNSMALRVLFENRRYSLLNLVIDLGHRPQFCPF